ncbi:MAG: LysR family transcriptional regulator [Burkholderiaceae bacterium]
MNTRFDWNLIRSFLAALDSGSLLGASRTLGSTQPTIGRHISELESQLGTVLFERTGRGLLPTNDGVRLAEAARMMESAADLLARTAVGAKASAAGTVRITASQPVACVLLPPILARMRITLPDIQVELVSSNAVSNLLRREADIAVRMVRPDQATLIARRIGQVPISPCAHQGYLARRGTPRQPGDLLRHDIIATDRNDEVGKGLATMGLAMERHRLALRTDDLMAYWAAVRAGMGIGFVSTFVMRTDDQVRPLLPMIRIPPLPVWLAVHREIRTSPRIRAVYDFLGQAIVEALAGPV